MKTLKVMAEFGAHPLWLPETFENPSPGQLPITDTLASRIVEWDARYQSTLDQDYPPNSSFASAHEHESFVRDGLGLSELLADELGPTWRVEYVNDISRARTVVAPQVGRGLDGRT